MPDLTTFQQQNGGAPAFQFMDKSGFNASGQYVPAATPPPSNYSSLPGAPKVSPNPTGGAVNNQNFTSAAPNDKNFNLFSTPTATSADAAYASVGRLGSDITSYANKPFNVPGVPLDPATTANYNAANTDLKSASEAYKMGLESRRKELESEKNSELARINAQYDQLQQKTEQAQKNETGVSNRNLLYLQQGGQSASAQAYLVDLENQHRGEIAKINDARNQALQAAQSAYAEKDFQYAQSALQEARNLEKEIYARNQDFINQSLQIKQEQRQQLNSDRAYSLQVQQEERDQQKFTMGLQQLARDFAAENGVSGQFYLVGNTAYDTATGAPVDLATYQKATGQTGLPQNKTDFSKIQVLSDAQAQMFQKKSQQQIINSLAEKYFDAGISPTDSLQVATEKIKKGSRIYAEQVRPPQRTGGSGGSSKLTPQQKGALIGRARQALADSRGQDGKYDPGVYLNMRQDYAEVTGEVDTFDNAYAAGLSAQERANLGVGKAQGVKAGGQSDEDSIY